LAPTIDAVGNSQGGVKSWINFFDRLVSRLDKKIGTHLQTETGAAPW